TSCVTYTVNPCWLFLPFRIFLYSAHLHHRVRHSFPTRRSSDLPLRGSPDAPATRTSTSRARRSRSSTTCRARSSEGGTVPAELRDRKSTRLNSSHRTISYAVFCLKKKTTTTLPREHECSASSLE